MDQETKEYDYNDKHFLIFVLIRFHKQIRFFETLKSFSTQIKALSCIIMQVIKLSIDNSVCLQDFINKLYFLSYTLFNPLLFLRNVVKLNVLKNSLALMSWKRHIHGSVL